jgi:hypothetical protein
MPRSLSYALQPRPRIVAYGLSFEAMPCIAEDGHFEPASLQAETVALPARLLPRVWQSVWTPLFPPVIFTGPTHGELTPEDRELIWRRWGVPVYEQRLSAAGDLLAEECDAHQALHVRAGADLPSEHRRCPCGYTGRLLVYSGQPDTAVSPVTPI